jgi:YfiH family protein
MSVSDWLAAGWPAPSNIVAGTTLRHAEHATLPLPGRPVWLNQVHGANVVSAAHFEQLPDADACISSNPQLVCAVRTADCLPVLLCSTDGSATGAAHAGWRGLAAGVLENTVAKMPVKPESLMVWLGPAISQPAFEVGDEVRAAFTAADPAAEACFVQNPRGRWQADLYGLARQRLRAAGVRHIYGGGLCTYTDVDRFFSYRRDPQCGRMISFVGRSAP